MRQSKYLFLGGPLDGQWRAVSDGRSMPPGEAYAQEATNPADPVTARIVRYYRARAIVPGWFTLLTIYVTADTDVTEPGRVMPGHVQSLRPETRTKWGFSGVVNERNGIIYGESVRRLRHAIQRRGHRP